MVLLSTVQGTGPHSHVMGPHVTSGFATRDRGVICWEFVVNTQNGISLDFNGIAVIFAAKCYPCPRSRVQAEHEKLFKCHSR